MALEIIKSIEKGMGAFSQGFLNAKFCNRVIKRCNLFGKMTVSLPPNSGTASFLTSEEALVLDLTKAKFSPLHDPPDKSRAWVYVWVPENPDGSSNVANPVLFGPLPNDGQLYVLGGQDNGTWPASTDGTPPFKWVATGTCA